MPAIIKAHIFAISATNPAWAEKEMQPQLMGKKYLINLKSSLVMDNYSIINS